MVWGRVQRGLNGRQAVRNHRGWSRQGKDEISDDTSLLKLITLMTDLGDRAKACRAQPWRSSQLLTHRSLQLGCGQRQNCRRSQVAVLQARRFDVNNQTFINAQVSEGLHSRALQPAHLRRGPCLDHRDWGLCRARLP